MLWTLLVLLFRFCLTPNLGIRIFYHSSANVKKCWFRFYFFLIFNSILSSLRRCKKWSVWHWCELGNWTFDKDNVGMCLCVLVTNMLAQTFALLNLFKQKESHLPYLVSCFVSARALRAHPFKTNQIFIR